MNDAVASLLSVNPADERLGEIVGFFKKDKQPPADLVGQLRSLENHLGAPGLGEKRIDKIYRYIKLQTQLDRPARKRDGEIR